MTSDDQTVYTKAEDVGPAANGQRVYHCTSDDMEMWVEADTPEQALAKANEAESK